MKYRAGFSAIEIMIVLLVMAILITIAVISIRSSEARGRDTERTSDVTAIAQQLEDYYSIAYDQAGSDVTSGSGRGSYLATSVITATAPNINEALLLQYLPVLPQGALRAPGVSRNAAPSVQIASNQTETTAGVRPIPTTSTYVYQPIRADGTLCVNFSDMCTRFNLFYRLENAAPGCDGSNICVIRSKQR